MCTNVRKQDVIGAECLPRVPQHLLWSNGGSRAIFAVFSEVRRHPEKAKGAVRRWLSYLSLFVGAIILSADVTTLIYYLFEGQLTVRFLLKAAVLFFVAGSLFLYLIYTLRSETEADQ